MAHIFKDRVQDTTTTTGTGALTLAGTSPSGAETFDSVLANGDTCFYQLDDLDDGGTDSEVGLGTWNDTTKVLTRTTVYSSTNADAAVNWGAGTKKIRLVCPAELVVNMGSTSGTIPKWDGKSFYASAFNDDGATYLRASNRDIEVDNDHYLSIRNNADTGQALSIGANTSDHAYLITWAASKPIIMAPANTERFRVDDGGADVTGDLNVSVDAHITGNLAVGGLHSGTSKLWVKGGRFQVDNDEQIMALNTTNGTGFSIICDTANDMVIDAAGGIIQSLRAVMFDNTTYTPTGTTQTVDLDEGNNLILDLTSTTGNPTITLNIGDLKASSNASGRIRMKNHGTTSRTPSWAVTGGTSPTVTRVTEPTWASDWSAGDEIMVIWDWDGPAESLVLFFSDPWT